MKKAGLLVLIFVLAILPNISLYSCDETRNFHTIYGEIVYVKTQRYHAVYIAPVGQEDSGIWIPMMITPETQTASVFDTDVSKMPELSVGNFVEIVYDTTGTKSNHILVGGSRVVSLTVVSPDNIYKNEELDLKLKRNYEYTRLAGIGVYDHGTVIHVAKIEEPDNGYFVYVERNRYDEYKRLTVYWLDEDSIYMEKGGVFIDDRTLELIKSGEVFYAEINTLDEIYRFKDAWIPAILVIAAIEKP